MITPRAQLRWITALALTVSAVPPLAAQDDGSYSYFLTVEGTATLVQGDTDTRTAAETNLPILVGDRLWVESGSRLGILLSDDNRLHVEGDAEISFDRLAYSPDGNDRQTQLNVANGRLHLVVDSLRQLDEATRLDTANATVYLQDAGEYFIIANHLDYTEIVARSGFAEVLTRRGSSIVRGGEHLIVEGTDWPQVRIATAPGVDPFEDWALNQENLRLARASTASEYVDESLRYQAGDLDEHGQWVVAEGTRVWRPIVAVGWRPYWYGRWAYTPSGLYWVSNDPWSPVTYHYGTWDYHFSLGWVWYPGRVWAPAHVYWYWGPSYAGWVPWGYYGHHYSPYYPSFSFGYPFGTYGWAGGSWGHYRHWTFCPTRYVGHHGQHRYHDDSERAHNKLQTPDVPRGILTDDTRGLTPDTWTKADRVEQTLLRRLRNQQTGTAGEIPDATAFVAREERLPPTLERRLRETPMPAKPVKAASQPSAPRAPGANRAAELSSGRAREPVGAAFTKPQKGTPTATAERSSPRPPVRSAVPSTGNAPRLAPTRATSIPPRGGRTESGIAKPTDKIAPSPAVRPSSLPDASRPSSSRPSPRPPGVEREPGTTRMKAPPSLVDRSQAADSARRVLEPIRSRPAPTTPRSLASPARPVPRTSVSPSAPSRGPTTARRPATVVPRTPSRPTAVRPTPSPSRPSTVSRPSSRPVPRPTVKASPAPARPPSSVSRSSGPSVPRPSAKPTTVKSRPTAPSRGPSMGSGGGGTSVKSGSRATSASRSSGGGAKATTKPAKPRN